LKDEMTKAAHNFPFACLPSSLCHQNHQVARLVACSSTLATALFNHSQSDGPAIHANNLSWRFRFEAELLQLFELSH
jgi:hypothetical protein